ncbi:YraN family protein [bacterium]|nr:YraN family protein [bacterium]
MPNRRRVGAAFEERAEELLRERGFAIVARNFRTRYGEIDRIARRGDLLVFVEVKMRRGDPYGSAAEAVDQRKARQIYRMAEQFSRSVPSWRSLYAFDVIAIDIDASGRVAVAHHEGVDVDAPDE